MSLFLGTNFVSLSLRSTNAEINYSLVVNAVNESIFIPQENSLSSILKWMFFRETYKLSITLSVNFSK